MDRGLEKNPNKKLLQMVFLVVFVGKMGVI